VSIERITTMEEAIEPTALGMAAATADFIAGGVAGMSGVLAGAPLDVIRIRQQQPRPTLATPANITATVTALPQKDRNIVQLLRHTLRTEGPQALFRGTVYPLSTAALQNAVCFHSYGAACRQLASATTDKIPLSLENIFWAGCFAGGIQTAIVTPIDLLKIRLQLQTARPGSPGYIGPLSMLQRVVAREGGFRSLYRGVTITAIRDVPSHGVYFAAFEWVRELLEPGCRAPGKKSKSAGAVWAAGGLAGALSWLSVYPFDVIKSRIQANSEGTSRYTGLWDCAARSYREEGSAVFLRGLPATLCRAFLVNGAIFTAYEASHSMLIKSTE
jgi:solute carrier family 25 (mitochondrial carnitine/acylcarnitine transporter), member 20/29